MLKMKLLDYTILTLLASTAANGWSQVPLNNPAQAQQSDDLSTSGSNGLKGLTFKPNTSLTVDKDNFVAHFGQGGVVWATEDPSVGHAELTVSAPSVVAFENGRITKPVSFYLRSNYPDFIERQELFIYRANDTDLVSPVVVLPLAVGAVTVTEWDGVLPEQYSFRAGDSLIYVVRAYGKDGAFDETFAYSLQLVTPQDAQRNTQQLRENFEASMNQSLSLQDALRQSLLSSVFAGNGLRLQNIPIYGSRVRVQGRNLASNTGLEINAQSYPVDQEGKFVAEFLMPVGKHRFNVSIQDGKVIEHQQLDVNVTGSYFFGIALADLTLQGPRISGARGSFAAEGRDKDLLTDARLAFYLKSKVRAKYLITAQADTQERELKDLFTGFTDSYPQDVFRRVDPEQYYPTYGDDSSTFRDVDTQGRMYLRVDWDKNQALWGNYATGLTGTELAQYQRSLYGAALSWRSKDTTKLGDARTQLRLFGSEANTAHGYSEFVGTGGSLYYLRHTDIVPGSELVRVEVRDPSTGRTISSKALLRGADYEIDDYQGRIITRRPLLQIVNEGSNTITRDGPLSGYEQRLLVDYEYAPSGLESKLTAGGRAKHWLNNHVAVGATLVEEQREGDDYRLKGVDVTLQAGRGTYLKVEQSHSESTSAPVFFSSNGGLSFEQLARNGVRSGNATAVELRANLQEQGLTDSAWTVGGWWRDVDAGFSTARTEHLRGNISEYGAEALGEITPDLSLYAKHSVAKQDAQSLTKTQVTAEWRFAPDESVSAELQRVDEDYTSGQAEGTLGALKYSRRVNNNLELYGIGQVTLDNDGGRYRDNNALTVGGRYDFNDQSSVNAEVSGGDRGTGVRLLGEYKVSQEHSFYGGYTYASDFHANDGIFNNSVTPGWTLGQRWRLSDQTNLFNESQYLKDANNSSGLAHTFGMDFYPGQNWRLGYTLQHAKLKGEQGQTNRDAISIFGGRTTNLTNWQSKVEWRRDSGAERRHQWVLTNYLTHKVDESWRIAGKFNYSKTTDKLVAAAGAKFVEGSVGFAYRPWNSSRWGVFGRYTHVYDRSSLGQVGSADGTSTSSASYYDQKANVVSLEGVYRWTQRWETAGKLAYRTGKARYNRGEGPWFNSGANFAAVQARYEVMHQWHAMAEYRLLAVKDGGNKRGWMLGVDRDITENFRLGIGYNFTDFKGDLTRVDDYRNRGWFLNLVGYY